MKHIVRLAQLTLVSGFALIGAGMPSLASADGNHDAHLRGSYAFTTTRNCTIASAPFVGDNLANPPSSAFFRQSAVDSGIYTFNGDGTATATGRSSSLNMTNSNPGATILAVSEFNANLNYAVNGDGTVDIAVTSTFDFVFGPLASNNTTGTLTGQVARLQISDGNSMLVSAPAGQVTQEFVSYDPPLAPPFENGQWRICVRSTTATKLPGDRRD
jgi:hypothetical protein